MNADSPNWLRRLVNQISQAQDLQPIFNTTVVDLRSFLGVDRVKICQFRPDERVQVMAEAIHDHRLPSLLSLHFPMPGLCPYSRELLLQARGGAMVNLKTKTICKICLPNENQRSSPVETINYFPIDSHYAQSLTTMGVEFSIVKPIFYHEAVWGLLIAHHSSAHFVPTRKFEVLQLVVDQLAVAITQQTLRTETQTRAGQDTLFNRIVNRLQASPEPEFQSALEAVVAAFEGSGGRLCMRNQTQKFSNPPPKNFAACLAASDPAIQMYTCGAQPQIPVATHTMLMEQYRLWQDHYQSGSYLVWPISNLYQTLELEPLFDAFRPTSIDSLLMIPLTYRQELLGYLSIFRNSGGSNSSQTGQIAPEQPCQVQEWTNLELAQKLGQQFAVAIHNYELSQQAHHSETHFNTEIQQHTAQLQQVVQQQQGLSEILSKIKAAIDPETIFQTTTKELCRLLQAERVSVYRFNADWGGEFVHDFEYVNPTWLRTSKLGRNTAWNDTYLQETQGGRYRYNETFAADDIYQANLSPCHIEILEQFHIKAFATAPVFVGQRLWGVLAAYQHSQTRQWLTTDILFLSQTASSLGLALQQAGLLAQTQAAISPYKKLSKEVERNSSSRPLG